MNYGMLSESNDRVICLHFQNPDLNINLGILEPKFSGHCFSFYLGSYAHDELGHAVEEELSTCLEAKTAGCTCDESCFAGEVKILGGIAIFGSEWAGNAVK